MKDENSIFSEVKLENNKIAKILRGKASHFFIAMTESKGDSSLLIKSLIAQLTIIDDKKITIELLDNLSLKDACYLTEVIGLQLADNFKNGF